MRPMSRLALLGSTLALVGFVSSKPPEACKLLTLEDVTAVLGAGYVLGPKAALMNTSEISTCLYQKGSGSVAVGILPAQEKDGKATVFARQEGQKRGGRTVTSLPTLCDAAFIVSITPTNSTLVAGKGPWQIEVQVTVAQKPNPDAEQKLAKTICSRMT